MTKICTCPIVPTDTCGHGGFGWSSDCPLHGRDDHNRYGAALSPALSILLSEIVHLLDEVDDYTAGDEESWPDLSRQANVVRVLLHAGQKYSQSISQTIPGPCPDRFWPALRQVAWLIYTGARAQGATEQLAVERVVELCSFRGDAERPLIERNTKCEAQGVTEEHCWQPYRDVCTKCGAVAQRRGFEYLCFECLEGFNGYFCPRCTARPASRATLEDFEKAGVRVEPPSDGNVVNLTRLIYDAEARWGPFAEHALSRAEFVAIELHRQGVRGRPEGPSAPPCLGPNSHAEYNSLVATAEALSDVAEAALDYVIAESAVGESVTQWDALVKAVRAIGALRKGPIELGSRSPDPQEPMSFWNYNKYRPTDGGDSRKLVTLMEHDMVWVGIRAFNGATGEWINNGEPERARVLAWMELPQPAQGRWVHGKLLGVEKLSGAAPQGETE